MIRSASHPRIRPAFTLIEMMIVVLIVAILGAVAVARLGDTSITRLNSAAQLLVADLSFAQIESIGHADAPRVIVFDLVNHSYHIAVASDPLTPITNPTSKAPYRVTFGESTVASLAGVTISSVSAGGDSQIRFGVYGQIDQAVAATVTLTCGDSSVTITIHAVTGEATIGDIVSQ